MQDTKGPLVSAAHSHNMFMILLFGLFTILLHCFLTVPLLEVMDLYFVLSSLWNRAAEAC